MRAEEEIIILGSGESGVGAALLARQQGLKAFVSDRGAIADRYKAELEQAGIEYEEGRHSEERILAAREVVKSPGIPDTVPLVRQLADKGVPVIAEIEFAARYTRALLVGITGSNGKTTTATLTHHLLAQAGFDARLGGNVGHSFARLLAEEEPAAIYVLELSSFQLDGIRAFRPQVAALLNITPDHLDRYDYRLENYAASKLRITRNQQPEDLFLYWAGDANIRGGMERFPSRARLLPVHTADVLDERIVCGDHVFDLAPTRLRGVHNALNACFAAHIALELGAEPAGIQEALESFVPVPHRLELVRTLNDVEYINDSKATNVDAVFYALGAMKRPVVWIAGGTDKGNDYGPIRELVREKVRALVCLGQDNTKLKAAFGEDLDTIVETRSAADAVREAHRLARPGDTVLLSPACASFDLFRNYEDRGAQFREEVRKL